jgi:hypothetical protein
VSDQRSRTGRLLLFDPDPVKRHYFQKYVLGVMWRRLSEAERQERIAAIGFRHAESGLALPDLFGNCEHTHDHEHQTHHHVDDRHQPKREWLCASHRVDWKAVRETAQ